MFVSLACGARDQAAFSTHWAGWQKVMTDWTEEPPMAEYCAFDEQDDRDLQTFEVVPLPKVM